MFIMVGDQISVENLLRGIFSYGFEVPSAIQSKSIPFLQSGKDVIAQAQSGTGKTTAWPMSGSKLNYLRISQMRRLTA